MNQHEAITRDAARAIKLNADIWIWDEVTRALVYFGPNGNKRFSPITNPADAYTVEDALHMSVRYRDMGFGAMTLQVSCPDHSGSIMHAVAQGQNTLAARMYAITQFAALTAAMEDKHYG